MVFVTVDWRDSAPGSRVVSMANFTRRTTLAALALAVAPAAARAVPALPEIRRAPGFDGTMLALRTLGEGRPTLLMHGFLSNGGSWFRRGLAERLATQGRRLIVPDFRGHGDSASPSDPAAYPEDALCRDMEAILKAEGARDFDMVGYSMGSLIAVRMLVRGARPGKVVLGGMGDARIEGVTPRDDMFRDGAANGIKAGSPGALAVAANIARSGLNGHAIVGVLASLGRTTAAELKMLKTPVLVVCGDQDNDNGAAEGLAAALDNARALRVPGVHGAVPATAPFMDAVANFLGRPA